MDTLQETARIVTSKPYGSGVNPYGIASLEIPPMKSQQEYDVSLSLTMPRSNPNVERGNFMISLHMLDSKADFELQAKAGQHAAEHGGFGTTNVLFSSRRPALFPFVDPFVSLASRVLFLAYHLFAPGSSSSTMMIPLAERVWFSKGSMIPKSAYIEVEAGQTIQIYHAALQLTAQLRGLRWLMVHYRISTFVAFTFLFLDLRDYVYGRGLGRVEEDEEETDHPETFPTYGKQRPLKYEPDVKHELDPEQPLSEIPRAGADADDEDEGSFEEEEEEEEDVQHKDSGIGTSYSEEGSASIRRRASRSRME
ncbi:hypothetical protein CEP52_012680 [Fusarium oligoseptatum]|uniref:Seipin n=1 Tax=Fusarium oligoseptatum TaxID=2604345 RepID=A0A428SX54_9HYPO|nr:hypothetical protein CEP52_012680 [Fusarium oligoseptatum]